MLLLASKACCVLQFGISIVFISSRLLVSLSGPVLWEKIILFGNSNFNC